MTVIKILTSLPHSSNEIRRPDWERALKASYLTPGKDPSVGIVEGSHKPPPVGKGEVLGAVGEFAQSSAQMLGCESGARWCWKSSSIMVSSVKRPSGEKL